MRVQLTRAALLVVLAAPALAVADDGPRPIDPYGKPAASEPAPAAPGTSDTVTKDDYRDVFAPKEAPPPDPDAPEPPTGTVRAGVYDDSDKTTVYRLLGVVARSFHHWSLSGSVTVDAITSASVDVRSSPALS